MSTLLRGRELLFPQLFDFYASRGTVIQVRWPGRSLRFCRTAAINVRPAAYIEQGGEDMSDLLTAFGSYGFPMGVTAFLLVRIETKLGALNDSIRELAGILAKK